MQQCCIYSYRTRLRKYRRYFRGTLSHVPGDINGPSGVLVLVLVLAGKLLSITRSVRAIEGTNTRNVLHLPLPELEGRSFPYRKTSSHTSPRLRVGSVFPFVRRGPCLLPALTHCAPNCSTRTETLDAQESSLQFHLHLLVHRPGRVTHTHSRPTTPYPYHSVLSVFLYFVGAFPLLFGRRSSQRHNYTRARGENESTSSYWLSRPTGPDYFVLVLRPRTVVATKPRSHQPLLVLVILHIIHCFSLSLRSHGAFLPSSPGT